jgi:predicted membrane protein
MSEQDSSNPQHQRGPSSGTVILGFLLLLIGFLLLLDKLDFILFPHWVFSWKMILIVVGLAIGAKQGFRNPGWLIMVMIGTFFLLDDITSYHWQLHRYGLPVGIMVVGLFVLFRSVMKPSNRGGDYFGRHYRRWNNSGQESAEEGDGKKRTMGGSGEDFLNITTAFGGTKRKIFSKNFQGGDITNFFGGTELDFSQADIKDGEVAMLDITQMFGGVKLFVPANWVIKSDMTAILGGYDDKRSIAPTNFDGARKTLVIDGTCVFGGVEIKSI